MSEYEKAVRNRSALESQLKENEQVKQVFYFDQEFDLLNPESQIFKQIGPCLVKQDRF
jgi:chaperonin cofactor prefoldin